MILLPAIKAAYAAIPKTASISMVQWLGAHWTVKHQGAHHCYEMPLDKADWLVFTIVRFPPARLLSLWRHTNPHGRMPFKGFMKHAIRHAVYKAPGPAPWYQCNQAACRGYIPMRTGPGRGTRYMTAAPGTWTR
jgi:hypothetical protein